MSIVKVIEIGFGSTSVTTGKSNGKPEIKTFQSIVARVDPMKKDLTAGLNTRNTITLEIDGSFYEVGEDASLLSDRKFSRVLNSDYIDSAQYKALFLCGLNMCNATEIDVLVLGLPVSSWSRRDELKEFAEGVHEINDVKVNVKNAWVIPQPLGGLLAYANSIGQAGFDELSQENILSIDPGYGTFDWLFSTGLMINENRSNAVPQGMSAVIDSVKSGIAKAFPTAGEISNDLVDNAFWKNPGVLKINGNKYPFPVCERLNVDNKKVSVEYNFNTNISDVTSSAMTALRNSVGTGADVDLIILMGGPNEVYHPELIKAFPEHKIVIVNNPIRAICEGMYWGGLQVAASSFQVEA